MIFINFSSAHHLDRCKTNQGRRNKFHRNETGEEFRHFRPVSIVSPEKINGVFSRSVHMSISQRFLESKVSDVADLPKYFPIDNRLPCNHPPPPLLGSRDKY